MDMFNAIAEPQRRKVVELLARKGRMSATEISRNFDVTPQAMSQHLKVLRESEVVDMERVAQKRFYSINRDSMKELERWIMELEKGWGQRLDRLDGIVQSEKRKRFIR
ncbi:MAG: winged helix-turn-helix transcriptional regulator [Candidatus Micrarchaeota archaeon]|nr:winged helix-turn-helix transcriptional regulator [Candidatus Micrarchaeota archaeon]